MENIKLDKNYNILEHKKGLYDDDFVDAVDLITKAESDKTISEKEALFLLNVVLKREFINEAKAILPFTRHQTETRSMFMNLKSKQIKHA